jgi:radical SAM protein with 4Fe4S-binding SPASM domain
MLTVFLEAAPIEQYCPAGLATLSVDCQGNAYPCFMFTGIEDLQIGNVFDPEFPDEERVSRVWPVVLRNDKRGDPACEECWASPFCSGCLARDYFVNGGSFERTGCSVIRAMAEEFISKVVAFVPAGGGEDAPGRVEVAEAPKAELLSSQ